MCRVGVAVLPQRAVNAQVVAHLDAGAHALAFAGDAFADKPGRADGLRIGPELAGVAGGVGGAGQDADCAGARHHVATAGVECASGARAGRVVGSVARISPASNETACPVEASVDRQAIRARGAWNFTHRAASAMLVRVVEADGQGVIDAVVRATAGSRTAAEIQLIRGDVRVAALASGRCSARARGPPAGPRDGASAGSRPVNASGCLPALALHADRLAPGPKKRERQHHEKARRSRHGRTVPPSIRSYKTAAKACLLGISQGPSVETIVALGDGKGGFAAPR